MVRSLPQIFAHFFPPSNYRIKSRNRGSQMQKYEALKIIIELNLLKHSTFQIILPKNITVVYYITCQLAYMQLKKINLNKQVNSGSEFDEFVVPVLITEFDFLNMLSSGEKICKPNYFS